MEKYQTDMVENLLRNYYSLQSHPSSTFYEYKIDLDVALAKLKKYSSNLYSTIVNVFINGMPIQEQAAKDGVTRQQLHRRMHDGLHFLTMIMNGEVL
jgi:hypothetical protein